MDKRYTTNTLIDSINRLADSRDLHQFRKNYRKMRDTLLSAYAYPWSDKLIDTHNYVCRSYGKGGNK